MKQSKFDKLKKISLLTAGVYGEEIKDALTLICITSTRSPTNGAQFSIAWEGDQELIYNSAIAMFRSNTPLSEIMNKAYLAVLHERTVASYDTRAKLTSTNDQTPNQ